MTGKEDVYRGPAIRALCRITDVSTNHITVVGEVMSVFKIEKLLSCRMYYNSNGTAALGRTTLKPLQMWGTLWSCSTVNMELEGRNFGALVSDLRLLCCRLWSCHWTFRTGQLVLMSPLQNYTFSELPQDFFWGPFEYAVCMFCLILLLCSASEVSTLFFFPFIGYNVTSHWEIHEASHCGQSPQCV